MSLKLHLRAWMAVGVMAAASVAGAADDFNPFGGPRQVEVKTETGDADFAALQLSGISHIGSSIQFNLVDPRTRRGFWVPLNGTVNGVSVVGYDSAKDSVQVTKGTAIRSIALRRPVIVAMAPVAPAASPTVVASAPQKPVVGVDEIANPKTPQEIAQAETEARMMVSDLLEISMRERARARAEREAQRRPQGQSQ